VRDRAPDGGGTAGPVVWSRRSANLDAEGTNEEGDVETLPSAMAMEAAGDTRPIVREAARQDRRALAAKALQEQAFSILWERHGTGDDRDQVIAWYWFRLGPWVNAVMSSARRQDRTAHQVADDVDDMIQRFGL
jgi:hypothetical protein